MKTDILILVESKERELESACLLSEELKRRGYQVVIESVYPNKEKYIFKYAPSLIVTPWVYNDNDMKYFGCFYIHRHTQILNLHHEQYSGNDLENACLPKNEARKVYHISWGNEFSAELEATGCQNNDICQSGNIRLDFFKNRFRKMSMYRDQLAAEFQIDPHKKWVMFIANGYHLANEKGLSNMCTIDKNARIKADISQKTRLTFLTYVDKYLEENDDVVFIYRPHPVYCFLDVKQADILYLHEKYPERFFCIFAYPIRHWIINVNAVMSFHSTSGVECFAAKKDYILFRPVEFDQSIDYEFYKNYPYVIKNYENFFNFMKKDRDAQIANVYSHYFDVDPCEYSYIKICDFIERIIKQKNCKNRASIKNVTYMAIKSLYKSLISAVSKIPVGHKMLEQSQDSRYKHMIKNEVDYISPEEIDSISRMLNRILNSGES